jgi:DNA repair exonuclease SbcCD ATPase subunit
MKFTFHAPERSHGLRVIDTIPDYPLSRVEGLNGIGKTLALHLLELCTGQQPYRTRPDAWRTLCQYLGPTQVIVEGLRGERNDGERNDGARANGDAGRHTLRFAFDWRDRAELPVPLEVTSELFDEITLDGDEVGRVEDVRRWLAVVRIAGDETLIETIAALVAHDRERLRAASRIARARSDYADRVLTEMVTAFPPDPARRALEIAEELRRLLARLRELADARIDHRATVERLELAEQAYAVVRDVSANADTLHAEIQRLRERYEDAQTRTRESSDQLKTAREQERLSEEATKKLASAQRTFTRRLNQLKAADQEIEKAAAHLGVEADAEPLNAAREEVAHERNDVAQARADLEDVFALRDLLNGLVNALAPAAVGGLRARTVAIVADQTLTAGDLLEAVRHRRERLLTDAPAVEELDKRLALLEARDDGLAALETQVAEREMKRAAVAEAEQALEELSNASGSDGDSVAERAAAHAATQRVEIEVAAALGAAERQLAQLGGGLSLDDLNAALDRRLAEAGTTTTLLHDELRGARVHLAELDDQLDAATSRRDKLEATGAELGRTLNEQTFALQNDERHARLRAIVGDRGPDPSDDSETLARAWTVIHDAEDRTVRRLQAARRGLDALAGNMNDLLDMIRQGDRPTPELDPIRKHYEGRLLEQFDQPELLKALFDDGDLVRIDLAAREMRWKTRGGEPRVRPFQAFSSGERAFAYVQARLAAAGELTALNRVVAIDEFGAFLSLDRLIRLREAVQRQVEGGAIDQAIVVLPLLQTLREEGTDQESEADYVTGVFDPLATR